LLLRSAGRCQFALASDGLHPRDVLTQAANLFQALGLSHIELELQLEQLVAELVLLVPKFLSCQVPYFFGFHSQFSVLASLLAVPSGRLRASQTRCAGEACAKPDAWPPSHPAAKPLPSRTESFPAAPPPPNGRALPCLCPYGFRPASW